MSYRFDLFTWQRLIILSFFVSKTFHYPSQVHDPPLNHIGLWVDALPQAVDWLTAQGVRFTPGGIRTGAAGYDVVFIHPKSKPDAGLPYSGQGVLIELVQAPADVIEKSK